MKKDPLLLIEDIYDSILAIQEYLDGVDKEAFLASREKQDAVLHRLAIMGEAVKKLPAEFRERHPHIPWKYMAGTRDVLIHDYDGVSLHMIWDIVKEDLPPLADKLRPLLEE
ncbi:MAG: DUF86 domain-containing protein [Desulfarculus sp.]|nr:DUF86 domain-containing protein [Desulfarculus sp.]